MFNDNKGYSIMTKHVYAYAFAVLLIGSIKMFPMDVPPGNDAFEQMSPVGKLRQQLAKQAGMNEHDSLPYSAFVGDVDGVTAALRNGARLDARIGDENEEVNPLHLAAGGGHEQIVQLLLDNGAYINADIFPSHRFGQTPLWLARRLSQWSVVRVLLRNGALYDISAFYEDWLCCAFDRQKLVPAVILGRNELIQHIIKEETVDLHKLHEALLYAAVQHQKAEGYSRADIVRFLFGGIVAQDKNASFNDLLQWLKKLQQYYANYRDTERVQELAAMYTLIANLINGSEQPAVTLSSPHENIPAAHGRVAGVLVLDGTLYPPKP